jgi:hypothetical protein
MNREGNGDGGKSDGNGNKEGKGKGGKSDGYEDEEGNGDGGKIDGNSYKEGNGKGGKRFSNGNSGGGPQKRAMARAARAMAMATKRVMATNSDNTGNGYGKEGGGRLAAMTTGTARRTHPLAL